MADEEYDPVAEMRRLYAGLKEGSEAIDKLLVEVLKNHAELRSLLRALIDKEEHHAQRDPL